MSSWALAKDKTTNRSSCNDSPGRDRSGLVTAWSRWANAGDNNSPTSGSFTPGVEGPSLNLNASFDAGLEVLAAKSSESVWSASPTSSVGDVQAPASLVVSNTAARADVPRHAAQQISASVQLLADDTAEVSLNPEKLGRVRIAISTLEIGVSIALTAELGETMEMLRRHASDLEIAFQDMGHTKLLPFNLDKTATSIKTSRTNRHL